MPRRYRLQPRRPPEDPGDLRDAVRRAIRVRGYSRRTETAYAGWIQRFVDSQGGADPASLDETHLTEFLSSLAVERGVSPSTQNQALAAVLFLYREVYGRELSRLAELVRAKEKRRLPVVMSRAEVRGVLGAMTGTHRLMATVLYGTGVRLLECCQLRVKDLDFDRRQVVVRSGKGGKDRITLLPESLVPCLRRQVDQSLETHRKDLLRGAGWVELPIVCASSPPTPAVRRPGSGSSPPSAATGIPSPASSAATTGTSRASSAP